MLRFVSRFESDVTIIHAGIAQNDMLMWLMSEAKGVEKSLEGLVRRMLLVNFASIHTTSNVSRPPTHFDLSQCVPNNS